MNDKNIFVDEMTQVDFKQMLQLFKFILDQKSSWQLSELTKGSCKELFGVDSSGL